MTDLNDFMEERIFGVRSMWEIDFSDADDATIVDGVRFINKNIDIVVLPTAADTAVSVDVHSFVDGKRVDEQSIIIRQDT